MKDTRQQALTFRSSRGGGGGGNRSDSKVHLGFWDPKESKVSLPQKYTAMTVTLELTIQLKKSFCSLCYKMNSIKTVISVGIICLF